MFELFIIVGSLLLIDLIVFIVWHLKDPLHFSSEATREGPITNDVKTVYQFQQCRSKHHMVWIGLLYSIKGILIVLGIYLSYETRASKIETVNDAHLVRMCTYNIFVSEHRRSGADISTCVARRLDRLLNLCLINAHHRTQSRR